MSRRCMHCIFCGSKESLKCFKGRIVCLKCADEIAPQIPIELKKPIDSKPSLELFRPEITE